MQGIVATSKVNELIWHALTANGVEDRAFRVTWWWSSCPVSMKNCIGRVVTKREPLTIPVFEVYFSTVYFRFATEIQRKNTIIHEACHVTESLRVGGIEHLRDPHGPDWETAVLRTGYIPTATTVLEVTEEERRQIKNLT